jgi:4-amino-4-deoxy-L-arabinose transferase-like glycosyltransferase
VRLTVLLLIALAGLGLRLDAAWQGSENNLPDSAAYERIARGLERTGQFEQIGPGTPARAQAASNYSPGLPLLVGGIFTLTGSDDARTARVVLALIAALSIPLTYLLGVRMSGVTAGLAGAAVVAFYPTMIGDAGMILTEPLAGTMIIGAVLLLLRARDRNRLSAWIPPGILLGLTALVRPEYLAITAALGLMLALAGLWRERGWRPMAPVAVMLLSALVVIAPWTARTYAEQGRLVPISTGGGQTLFSGSYLPSGGDPQKVTPRLLQERPSLAAAVARTTGRDPSTVPDDQIFAIMAARTYPSMETDAALALMGRRQYLAEMRRDPVAFSAFIVNKAHRIWWRGRSTLTDHAPGKLLHWMIAVLSLAGLAGLARCRPYEFRVLALLLVAATLVGVLFVASPRRALVLWPLVSSLSGVGLALAGSMLVQLPRSRRRPVAIP